MDYFKVQFSSVRLEFTIVLNFQINKPRHMLLLLDRRRYTVYSVNCYAEKKYTQRDSLRDSLREY